MHDLEKREKILGDNEYTIILPAVRVSMPLCSAVSVLIAPALTSLGGDNADSLHALSQALATVDPEKVDDLLMRAVRASKLTCGDNKLTDKLHFQKHFAKNRADVYPVTMWVLWECVRDFFPQAETFSQMFKTTLGKEFQSQSAGKKTTG